MLFRSESVSWRSALAGVAAAGAFAALPAQALTLYDAGLGTAPAAQGWLSSGTGPAPLLSVGAAGYGLDTSGSLDTRYGSARLLPLDMATGFDLAFSLRVTSESHASTDRAGYSVLVVGSQPAQSLEVGFWSDRVWVYELAAGSPGDMVRGAGAAFDTASAPHDYRLSVRGGLFTLQADGAVLLSGGLRDYRTVGPVYNVPGLLFFGDDTSSAASATLLATVAIDPVPEPASAALLLAGGAWLAWRWRRGGRAG